MENLVIQIKVGGKIVIEEPVKNLVEMMWDSWEELDGYTFKDAEIDVVDRKPE